MSILDSLPADLGSPVLSLILTIVILLLALVVFYHLIQKIANFIGKSKKEREAEEIADLKKREKKLLSELEESKSDISKKIVNLQKNISSEEKPRKRRKKKK